MLATRSARWVAGTVAVCLGLLGLSYVLLIGPRRAEAADLAEQNVAAQEQNDALRIKTAQLKAQFVTLPERQAELAKILRQVPPTAKTPDLVRSLDSMATASGVTLKTVTPGAAQYLTAATGQQTTPAAKDAVVAVPHTILVDGDYFQVVGFLRKLQGEMERAFLVTGLDVTAAAEGGSAVQGRVSLTITGRTFVLPSAAGSASAPAGSQAQAGAAGSGSGATPAPSGTAAATAAPLEAR